MWNKIHEKNFNGEIIYDDWLDEYKDIINSSNIILDIGCGLGNNTKYIKELNKDVISIDYSTYALDIVKKYLNENVLLHDITKKFSYDDNSIDLVITSPPYNLGNKISGKTALFSSKVDYDTYSDNMKEDEY